MVARIRVQVEKVSSLVRSWIYCEGRADGSPQGTFWLKMLGEWCSCLLKGRMRGEELAEGGKEPSPVWNVLSMKASRARYRVGNWIFQSGAQERGPRWRCKFRSHQDADGI